MLHFPSEFLPLFSLILLKSLMDSEHISCFVAENPAEPGGFIASQDKEQPLFLQSFETENPAPY